MEKGAYLSDCKRYRYKLWRIWDRAKPCVVWIMLNPSTADAETDDPTIKKCVKFAKSWGYGGIVVVNLFAWRATDPDELKKHSTLTLTNGDTADTYIERILEDNAGGLTVAAWGQKGKLYDRATHVRNWLIKTLGVKLHALKLSKDGTPWHPLYVRDDTKPFLLEGA